MSYDYFINNKKKINKVIINHNVYAESGLFGEFSQTLFGSKVCLVQRMFKDVIKIDNLKKDLFCYIPDFKSSGNEDKNFFWYRKLGPNTNKYKYKKLSLLVIFQNFQLDRISVLFVSIMLNNI